MFNRELNKLLENLNKDFNKSGLENSDFAKLFSDFNHNFHKTKLAKEYENDITSVHLLNELLLVNKFWNIAKTKSNLKRAGIFFGSLSSILPNSLSKNLATIIKELIEIAETYRE